MKIGSGTCWGVTFRVDHMDEDPIPLAEVITKRRSMSEDPIVTSSETSSFVQQPPAPKGLPASGKLRVSESLEIAIDDEDEAQYRPNVIIGNRKPSWKNYAMLVILCIILYFISDI